MGAQRYRKLPVEIDAIQLTEAGADQWDDVATFLGVNPNTGGGESATMRRPRRDQVGFVYVTSKG